MNDELNACDMESRKQYGFAGEDMVAKWLRSVGWTVDVAPRDGPAPIIRLKNGETVRMPDLLCTASTPAVRKTLMVSTDKVWVEVKRRSFFRLHPGYCGRLSVELDAQSFYDYLRLAEINTSVATRHDVVLAVICTGDGYGNEARKPATGIYIARVTSLRPRRRGGFGRDKVVFLLDDFRYAAPVTETALVSPPDNVSDLDTHRAKQPDEPAFDQNAVWDGPPLGDKAIKFNANGSFYVRVVDPRPTQGSSEKYLIPKTFTKLDEAREYRDRLYCWRTALARFHGKPTKLITGRPQILADQAPQGPQNETCPEWRDARIDHRPVMWPWVLAVVGSMGLGGLLVAWVAGLI
jgi:hypothetical protein